MKPRILVVGSSGQLGIELVKALSAQSDLATLSRREADLTNTVALRSAVRGLKPQIIVNAAAYTAVDRAEAEPELAHAVNAVAPQALAEEAVGLNAWLIHFSTDYVFDGSGTAPWKETDPPNPLSVYGRTKLEGERALAATGCRHLIFRTSWVYSAHSNNFLRTMVRLAAQRPRLSIVDDQVGAPTSAGALASAIQGVLARIEQQAAQEPESGVYHMTCGGSTSWFGFAEAIFKRLADTVPTPELVPIPSEQYPTPAARPRNSVLDGEKLQRLLGVRLPAWEVALDQVVTELRATGL